jgi:serine protease AprX
MSAESSLLIVRPGLVGGAEVLAATLEQSTGLRVRAFDGVRDPRTGRALQYLSINAPVEEVRPLVLGVAEVCRDAPVHSCTYRSVSTIRADVARQAYRATGRGIVWAVVDSGIDRLHPHFRMHDNLTLPPTLQHLDFVSENGDAETALTDQFGHGTFTAGIIAGESQNVRVAERQRDNFGGVEYVVTDVPQIAGMAPECKLMSVKVLDENGLGSVSLVIEALAALQRVNDGQLHLHGVSLGAGYSFEPEWFACGRTPVCIEVERLVRSGVVVVTAAGNTGFGVQKTLSRGAVEQGMEVSINDPGNAELAITVGSTHRELSHIYGVSYFSSKGPTIDGRMKPDLVAPGDKIASCLTGAAKAHLATKSKIDQNVQFHEDSGTSLAAAHVSGAAAMLLSARRDLIGQPEAVKAVLMDSAMELGRSRFYQGRGLVDVMQAMQQKYSARSVKDEGFAAFVTPELASASKPEPPLPAVVAPSNQVSRESPLRVMYSYSHKDEPFKQELHTYLAAERVEFKSGRIGKFCLEQNSLGTSSKLWKDRTSSSCW